MPRDELATVDQPVLLAVRELLGRQDRQERQEVLAEPDRLGSLEAVDCQVLREAPEEVDSEDSLELLVLVGHPVYQEVLVALVCQAELVLQVSQELLA